MLVAVLKLRRKRKEAEAKDIKRAIFKMVHTALGAIETKEADLAKDASNERDSDVAKENGMTTTTPY